MKRKLVAMTMACTLAATALTGCGGSSDGGSSAADTKTDSAAAETTTAVQQLRPQHLMQKALFIT